MFSRRVYQLSWGNLKTGPRVFLVLQILIAVVIAVLTGYLGKNLHYRIFTTAGDYLLHHKNPYGVDWGYGGMWFYSPVCGWFYGLFSFLPFNIGGFVYILLSYALFLEGFRRIAARCLPSSGSVSWYLSACLILSTGELIGALQSSKLEIAMVGTLMIIADIITERPVLAALLSSLLINFKWFPIAPIGLMAIVEMKHRRFKFAALTPLFLLLFFALPVFVYGWDFARELYTMQNSSLGHFVGDVYADFPSFFGMLHLTFGVKLTMAVVGKILAGVSLLLIVLFMAFSNHFRSEDATLLALSLGTLYVVEFNLLSQFNFYVIATPALLYALKYCFSTDLVERYLFRFAVAAYWIVVSLFHSDLVPHSFRQVCRDIRIKPLGALVMMVIFVFFIAKVGKARLDKLRLGSMKIAL